MLFQERFRNTDLHFRFSTSSAHIAAEFGMPYAFATHFAPAQFEAAAKIYRDNFRPSQQLEEPYLIACVNVIAADTTEKAQFISTSFSI